MGAGADVVAGTCLFVGFIAFILSSAWEADAKSVELILDFSAPLSLRLLEISLKGFDSVLEDCVDDLADMLASFANSFFDTKLCKDSLDSSGAEENGV